MDKWNNAKDITPNTQDGVYFNTSRELIICTKDGNVISGVFFTKHFGSIDNVFVSRFGYNEEQEIQNVAYWMYLPKPPKD